MSTEDEGTVDEEDIISISDLEWLADAPLYIDPDRISALYDAVLMPFASMAGEVEIDPEDGQGLSPRHRPERMEIELTEEQYQRFNLGGQVGGSLSLGSLLGDLSGLGNIELKASGDGEIEEEDTSSKRVQVVFQEVNQPARQLVQLALHYKLYHQDRISFPDPPGDYNWEHDEKIGGVPRELIFLDFPGIEEAEERDLIETRFVPTAAEFNDGIVPLYSKFGHNLPKYKELDNITLKNVNLEEDPVDELNFREIGLGEIGPDDVRTRDGENLSRKDLLRASHRNYWQEFGEIFSATQAIRIVEEAANNHGRLRWIDYRAQLTEDGDTLHLHITPGGNYDTGVFAYNFIKRAYKHGIRIVGVLKKEPDLDVLAIYNK
ncbi:hypothetical protein R3751_15215 [Halorubrum distributum]|uniref:hypothetical protein n=1 Tax=Halorubrum distributum TaxID=29283 RepID=UPI0029543D01|nr:hypothetical protein [Halorubrum distributum]MDV7351123.1 hypothetical protein [Halorubrum distributum]